MPIVIANYTPFADSRALHYDGTPVLEDFSNFLVEISRRTGTNACDDNPFGTKCHQSVGKPGAYSGVDVENIDVWEALHSL